MLLLLGMPLQQSSATGLLFVLRVGRFWTYEVTGPGMLIERESWMRMLGRIAHQKFNNTPGQPIAILDAHDLAIKMPVCGCGSSVRHGQQTRHCCHGWLVMDLIKDLFPVIKQRKKLGLSPLLGLDGVPGHHEGGDFVLNGHQPDAKPDHRSILVGFGACLRWGCDAGSKCCHAEA